MNLLFFHRFPRSTSKSVWPRNEAVLDPVQCDAVSYAACALFADSFDLLYQKRNTSLYPNANPMLKDPSQTIYPSTGDKALELINFPVANSFTVDEHGFKRLTGYQNAPGLDRFPGSTTLRDVWLVRNQTTLWVACSNSGKCGSQTKSATEKHPVKCCSNTAAGSDFWRESPWNKPWLMIWIVTCPYTLVLNSDANAGYNTTGLGQKMS